MCWQAAASFALVACLSACIGSEYSSDITDTLVDGERLFVSGTLNAVTYSEIEDQLRDHPDVRVVVLEDIDGSIDDEANLQTALLIHNAGLDTFVPADGIIESGAVDLFCAGHKRTAERGARIGVHSWADDTGLEGGHLPRDHDEHQIYLEYFNTVDCPEAFYWFTLQAAPAGGMHYMSEDELITYGVVTDLQ